MSSSGDARMNEESEEEEESETDALYEGVGGTVMTALAVECSLSALTMMTLNVYFTSEPTGAANNDEGSDTDDDVATDNSDCMSVRVESERRAHVYVAPLSFMLVFAVRVTGMD